MAKRGIKDSHAEPRGSARERVGDYVIIFKRSRKWYAQYMLDGRQRRDSLKTNNKDVALRKAREIEVKLSHGTFQPKKKAPRIDVAVQEYLGVLEADGVAESSRKRYRGIFDCFITFAEAVQATRLDKVTLTLMDAFRAMRSAEKKAPKTIYVECTVIRQLVNFALSRKLLASDPLEGFKLKKPKQKEQPNFTLQQVEAILRTAHPRWKPIFQVLAFTGMRIGELVWLQWVDINLERGFIQIRPKENWKPKDRDARRIPIHPRVRSVLNALPRNSRWVFTGVPCRQYPKGGQQISDRRALCALKRAMKKAGVIKGKIHTLRHFFISHCANSGVPPLMLADWVGHASLQMVMKYYRATQEESFKAMKSVPFTGQGNAK